MTESVVGKSAVKPAGDTRPPGAVSPAELLKQAVGGTGPACADAPRARLREVDLRLTAVAAVALLAGAALGVLAVPRDGGGEALARIGAQIETGFRDAERRSAEIEALSRQVVQMREAAETLRADGRTQAADLAKRLGRLEQGVEARLTAVSEAVSQTGRETGTRLTNLTAQLDRRPAALAAPPPAPVAAADPVRTGSIGEKAKPEADKPAPVDGWALRDVYDGVAVLEDRKRRLVEVAPGDAIPGVGRVEAIERRGRGWVVVTKLGLVTPQSW